MTPTARPSDADVREMARGLSDAQREVFRWTIERPNGDVRVHPYRDAKRMVAAGLVERRAERSNHALRREHVAFFLTPLGLALRRHLMERGRDA